MNNAATAKKCATPPATVLPLLSVVEDALRGSKTAKKVA
jgi:hypothetical protein